MFNLPTMTAPAFLSFWMTVASYGELKFSRIFDPHVVGMPRVQITSLIASGIPVSNSPSPLAIL
jgi:hypothetical protein